MTKMEVAAHEFAYKNHSWLKDALPTMAAVESFERGVKWRDANLWHDAQGDDLPEYGKEVIVLCDKWNNVELGDNLRVAFGHRPDPNGWDGINPRTLEKEHFDVRTYGKGGWNIPDVRWWLDVSIPNLEEEK